MEEFIRSSGDGFEVLWGRCYEGEGAPPYWPWIQVVRSFLHNHDPEYVRERTGSGAAAIAEMVPSVSDHLGNLPQLSKIEDPVSVSRKRWSPALCLWNRLGPRAMLFLRNEDAAIQAERIKQLCRDIFPNTHRGYPVRFSAPGKNAAERNRLKIGDPELEPRIDVYGLSNYFEKFLAVSIDQPLTVFDWLSITSQRLLEVVSGRIFVDRIGFQHVRDRFKWYPRDVWLYLLASCWFRIGVDEVLAGRAGSADDELGSKVIAMRLVRDMMRPACLLERRIRHIPSG